MTKIACSFYWDDEKYDRLGKDAVNSFKKWHPDIDVFVSRKLDILKESYSKFEFEKITKAPGITKLGFVLYLLEKRGYDKVICLGADTITCSYLDEFIDTDVDILATLDYPYEVNNQRTGTVWPREAHVNADVVCFSNVDAVRDIIYEACEEPLYYEQAGLNEIIHGAAYDYSYKIVDYPYDESDVVYNARAKGNIIDKGHDPVCPFAEHIQMWTVDGDKLFDSNGKHIKVMHYCQGFGGHSKKRIDSLIYYWKKEFLNEETKKYFAEHCSATSTYGEYE